MAAHQAPPSLGPMQQSPEELCFRGILSHGRRGSLPPLAYAVSALNTLDQLGLDPGSSLEISYTPGAAREAP